MCFGRVLFMESCRPDMNSADEAKSEAVPSLAWLAH